MHRNPGGTVAGTIDNDPPVRNRRRAACLPCPRPPIYGPIAFLAKHHLKSRLHRTPQGLDATTSGLERPIRFRGVLSFQRSERVVDHGKTYQHTFPFNSTGKRDIPRLAAFECRVLGGCRPNWPLVECGRGESCYD